MCRRIWSMDHSLSRRPGSASSSRLTEDRADWIILSAGPTSAPWILPFSLRPQHHRSNSAITRQMWSDKIKNSGGRCITWVTASGRTMSRRPPLSSLTICSFVRSDGSLAQVPCPSFQASGLLLRMALVYCSEVLAHHLEVALLEMKGLHPASADSPPKSRL